MTIYVLNLLKWKCGAVQNLIMNFVAKLRLQFHLVNSKHMILGFKYVLSYTNKTEPKVSKLQ